VRYNGVPVRDAYIKFTQPGSPIVAGGFTDDLGRYELTSYQTGDGAPVGENVVTIAVSAPPEADAESARDDAESIADPTERKKALAEMAQRRKTSQAEGGSAKSGQPRSRIPKKYASEDTSNLSFTVEAGVENNCDFDLTD
jgi:hypothetical protein